MSVPCPSDVNAVSCPDELALLSRTMHLWSSCLVSSVQVRTFLTALDHIHSIAQLVVGYFVLRINECTSECVYGFEVHYV